MLIDKGLIKIPEPEHTIQPLAMDAEPITLSDAAHTVLQRDGTPRPDLPPIAPTILDVPTRIEPALERPQRPSAPRVLSAPLEVVTLLELETILGAATKMEVATILGVATMLELTPKTAVRVPATDARLPPLAQAERDLQAMQEEAEPKSVIPAAILRSNLMAARAHLAAALDQFLEIDGYLLKQKVMACDNRDELEAMVPQLAAAFIKKIEKTAAKRLLTTAEAMLDR